MKPCEVGKDKFVTGEEVTEDYLEKLHSLIKDACEAERLNGIDELEKFRMITKGR